MPDKIITPPSIISRPATDTKQLGEALLELLEDDDIRRRALPPANFWNIVHYGENSYENRYNRVVRWLIDPTANHGLGADVINALVRTAAEHRGVPTPHPIAINRVRTFVETPATRVATSGRDVTGRIDVTLLDLDQRTVVAIESKLASTAHSDQLTRYGDHLDVEYAEWDRVMLFLTENEEKPSDGRWWPVRYKDLALILRRLNGRKGQDSAAERVIIDFCDDIDRRASGPLGDSVNRLYFRDFEERSRPADPRFARILIALAEHFSANERAMAASTAGRLRLYLQGLPGQDEAADAPAITEQLIGAFEASGKYSSSDLIRTLNFVIEHAPVVGVQNHKRSAGVSEFFADYLKYLTGLDNLGLEPQGVLPEQDANGYLQTVRMNLGRKGVTFNSGTPGVRPFRIAGNIVDKFPWWIAHTHKTTACGFAGRLFHKRPLDDWTPETLHVAVLQALSAAGETCRCGERLTR